MSCAGSGTSTNPCDHADSSGNNLTAHGHGMPNHEPDGRFGGALNFPAKNVPRRRQLVAVAAAAYGIVVTQRNGVLAPVHARPVGVRREIGCADSA